MGLYWYWEKDEIETSTPSIKDGLAYETEVKYRKEGARFILDCGLQMILGYNTLATGVVFFHRFYMFHTFKTFPPHVTAACCLFLAGKVEETPKRCKDIIKTAKNLLSEKDFANFGDDPVEEINAMERILLQTIKFDLKVTHPYFYLKKYIKCLKANKEVLQEVLQMAWNFVNDSLCTTLSIEWEPEIIAIAVIHLAGKLCKLKVVNWTGRTPEHKHWWDMFAQDLSIKILEDICHQILDLYSSKDKQSNLFADAAKAIGQRSSAPVEQVTPPKEPKIEATLQPSPPFALAQPNVPDPSKVPTSWTAQPPFPSGPPPENPMLPPFPLPNLAVPPPPSHSFTTVNSAMPPATFPITNLSIPPPVHMPFPPANLAMPPPSMINANNYYGGDQYLRY